MKKLVTIALTVLAAVQLSYAEGPALQIGTQVADAQPISEGARIALAAPTLVLPNSVGTKVAGAINDVVSWIATNGVVAFGVGNTLDKVGNGVYTEVLTVRYPLPVQLPQNKYVNLELSAVDSTCFSEKNHVGLGAGVTLSFELEWLKDIGVLWFKNLGQVYVGTAIAPDVDEACQGNFARDTTVASVTAGYKVKF